MHPIVAARRFAGVVLLVVLAAGCGSAQSDVGPPPAAGTRPASPTSGTGEGAVQPALLPGARAYVEAVNAGNLDALVDAFAADGQVVDVSRRITGQDAIRRWADNEVIGGSLRVDDVTPLGPDQQRVRVHWAPSGSSGWAADYTFTSRDGRIALADLQYAS